MQATVTGGSGRFQQNLLQTLFDATLIEARFGTTGEFRLYPNTFLSWIPLPPTWYSHRTPPTDLGWSGRKVLSDIVLDLEWVTPGDITLTVRGDTFLGHEVTYQRVYTQTLPQRQRLPRERLPAEPIRLLTVQIAGTCGFRLWPGSRLTWHALGGQPGVQTFPLAESIATSLRQTPLVGTEIGG
jgi:hypothetical protein